MDASIPQLILLGLSVIIVLGSSVVAYYFSLKQDKAWFYVYLMLIIVLVQWMSDLGSALVYQGYYLHLASVILFPAIIFALFAIYAFHGANSTWQLLCLLISGEGSYAAIIIMLAILGNTPTYLTLDSSWIRNHVFSTLAIVIDYLALVSVWPIIHNPRTRLPLLIKVWLIVLAMLLIDTLVFTLGTFWGDPAVLSILQGNLIVRISLSILISPLMYLYLRNRKLDYRNWNEFLSSTQFRTKIIESQQQINKLTALQLELAQKNQELRKFQLAVEQASDHIVITDPDGIVLYANPGASRITGFSREEIIGKKAGSSSLWGGTMPPATYDNLWQTIKAEKKPFIGEFNNHRKSGEPYVAESHVSPILDDQGDVAFFIGIERDITHIKEVDRMKTEFLSLASHQLRTPLSAMKWFLEMLQNGDMGKLTQAQSDAVLNVNQSNERMITLVNNLLNISRIESGRIIVEPQPTDITQLIASIVTELHPKFTSKQQAITTTCSPDLQPISIDPKLIREVILNLLTNANKYTPPNGHIDITASTDSGNLIIQVTDDGYGVPKVDQEHIFERFFRASNVTHLETDSTGLGLYLAKIITLSSGGTLTLQSEEGKGSTFTLTLPLTGTAPKAGKVHLT